MHGITKNDRGIVGFVKDLGRTWHGFPQYVQYDGYIDYEKVLEVVDYEVVKVPMAFSPTKEMIDLNPSLQKINGKIPLTNQDSNGIVYPQMFSLVRTDTMQHVYDITVSSDFTIYQNKDFLEEINKTILINNPQVCIESSGTLFGGRICFINIILDQFKIKNDPSDHIARIMFYNAFGGRAITACLCFVRVVCNNTMKKAEAEGALNKTLKKFRHTSGAPSKVSNHIISLKDLNEFSQSHQSILNNLVDMPMTGTDVTNFLGNLIEIPEEASSYTVSGRMNKREKIKNIFYNNQDLQFDGMARTRYAMLQAVTNYNQFQTIPNNSIEIDEASAWWDVSTGGTRNNLNQKAYEILIKKEIPQLQTV